MNKVTRIKNCNYTTISNVFLRDKKLSLKAKGLLATILSLPENWDFSIKGICATIKEGTTAVYSAIDELKELGYCKVVTNRNEKGMIVGNDYTFYEDPNVENLNMDNQAQINTNISLPNTKDTNIKEINKEEEEKEIDKSISKKGNKFALDMSFVDETFMPIVLEWLEYKKEKRQSYKQRGFNAMYESLLKMSNNNPSVAKAIVEQSMQNNYAGLFPLKNNTRFDNLPTGMIIRETLEERNEKLKNENGW